MHLKDYADHDGLGISALIRSGQVSASEVTVAARAAAIQIDPQINAFVEIWDGEPAEDGALHGVPFAVKDIGLTVRERCTEFGSRLAQGLRFPEDSDLMQRFRRAGLAPIGRTAIPELAMSVSTEPILGGPTRNPWDLSRSAGGSSGGAAAAVAAGIVPIAHATDAGGSIRVPASCTGLVGLKPSRGRVAIGSALDEIWGGLAAQFVLTRSVRDSAAMLDLLEGPGVGDPFEIARPTRPYGRAIAAPPGQLRIGYMIDPLGGPPSAAPVRSAMDAALKLLEGLGHHVEPTTLDLGISWDGFILAVGHYWVAYNAAFIAMLSQLTGKPIGPDTLEPASLAVHKQGTAMPAIDLIAAGDVRNQVTRALGRFFSRFDVLVTPTLRDERAGRKGSAKLAFGSEQETGAGNGRSTLPTSPRRT